MFLFFYQLSDGIIFLVALPGRLCPDIFGLVQQRPVFWIRVVGVVVLALVAVGDQWGLGSNGLGVEAYATVCSAGAVCKRTPVDGPKSVVVVTEQQRPQSGPVHPSGSKACGPYGLGGVLQIVLLRSLPTITSGLVAS